MRIASGTVPDESITTSSTDLNVYLDESSVVLITGAAGFLGSQLALALWKTYRVAKIIAIGKCERVRLRRNA
jgi:FlaA1/EpsC-like NDP-sugar epimerase